MPNSATRTDHKQTGNLWQSVSGDSSDAQKENPGALAGATGTDIESFWSWFDHSLNRQHAASGLVAALLNCQPEDRAFFLECLLDTLRPGWPKALMIDLMEEARWWVASSSRREIKAYALACYEGMAEADKRSFVAYVTGARHG